jgi:iron complex outermembrane recepter protein
MDSVTVKAFEQDKKTTSSAIKVYVIPASTASTSKTSVLNGLNAVSGVRMEERSPGSYRINIRGSSLRSPFGVRNIKVYWNDMPVTDPGGNTYFNQFAWNNFSSVEVFKGPASSMYGAGSGGLILLNSFEEYWLPGASVEYITGSYGLHNVFVSGRFGKTTKPNNMWQGSKNIISYAHNQADGYRTQTNMRRDNFSWISKIKRERHELTATVLFTDMYYQTPGALTLAEYKADPTAARPAGGGFPSAVNAKAGIYQKNILAGLSNSLQLGNRLKNTTSLYAAFAQIKNPAIRNYEKRSEPSFGGRTVFNFSKRVETVFVSMVAGAEFQQGYFNTQVFKNKNGNPDTLQTNDEINNSLLSVFAQASFDIKNSWFFITGASVTNAKLNITRLNRYPVTPQKRNYSNEVAPMFSLMKRLNKLSWFITLSKGFSPPTVSEVLPSTGVISTELEAEKGWNYESTLRYYLFRNKLALELTGFYLNLKDALVQRRDLSGADFFVNAGDVQQKGIEFHADYKKNFQNSFIERLTVRTDVTLNHFRYGSFIKGTDDFSGKKVPSVPSSVFSLLGDLNFAKGFYINANYYSASSIYMNDANTAKADPYHLLGCQLGWKKKGGRPYRLNVFAGIDNILNETYSLGNDINAAANRFYNAAPKRNYYIGLSWQWLDLEKK